MGKLLDKANKWCDDYAQSCGFDSANKLALGLATAGTTMFVPTYAFAVSAADTLSSIKDLLRNGLAAAAVFLAIFGIVNLATNISSISSGNGAALNQAIMSLVGAGLLGAAALLCNNLDFSWV